MRKGGYSGGGGSSNLMTSYEAELIVAAHKDRVVVLKDKYSSPKDSNIIDAICRLVSCYVFGKRYKLFVPAFEEDVKDAIENVINRHHLKIQKKNTGRKEQ